MELGLMAEGSVPWYSALWEKLTTFLSNNMHTIITFFCVLILGIIVIKFLVLIVKRMFNRSKVNVTAAHFLTAVIKAMLYIIYIIALLSLLGVPTTSMIALLSAFALAVSLALQDTISNLASGVVLVFTKPFGEGDFVELQSGLTGTVQNITMFSTRLLTPDNKVVVVPNNSVVSAGITNYSTMDTRRLDITLSVAYGTDLDKVKEIGLGLAAAHELVLDDPAPTVRLTDHGQSSLDFSMRVWVKKENYWPVSFDLKEQVVKAFAENGIEIPFNQLDVHVKNDSDADDNTKKRAANVRKK